MNAEGIVNRFKKGVKRQFDKCEKATVRQELVTFAETRRSYYSRVTIRQLYRDALKDRLYFRTVLDNAHKGPFDLITETRHLPISTTERRYYRQRGLQVPPVV